MLVLPLHSSAQLPDVKRQINQQLLFNGKDFTSGKDSMSINELAQLFEEDKVTVGHTAMTLSSFCISVLPKGKDLIGPYCYLPYGGIDTRADADTIPQNRKMAGFIKTKMAYHKIQKGDKVFIDNTIAKMASGDYCKVMKVSVFTAK